MVEVNYKTLFGAESFGSQPKDGMHEGGTNLPQGERGVTVVDQQPSSSPGTQQAIPKNAKRVSVLKQLFNTRKAQGFLFIFKILNPIPGKMRK